MIGQYLSNTNEIGTVHILQFFLTKQGLGSKDSSRQFRPNCVNSFYFRLYLILHAYV